MAEPWLKPTSTSAPPPGSPGDTFRPVVSLGFNIASDVVSFNAAAQSNFRARLANAIGGGVTAESVGLPPAPEHKVSAQLAGNAAKLLIAALAARVVPAPRAAPLVRRALRRARRRRRLGRLGRRRRRRRRRQPISL